MPPGAVLDVEAAGRHRARGAHLLAHGADLFAQRLRVARRREHGAPRGLEARRDGRRAGGKARPRQRLVLPGPGGVAAAAGLVGLEGGDGGHEQARIAVGPQRGVDVEQLAGRGAQRQPGDELAHEGRVDLLGTLLLVFGGVGVVVDEDDVEVAAVAQLLAAELAVGDDGQPRRRAVALLQARPGPAHGGVEHGVGQRRQVVGHLLHRQVAFDVAHQRAEDLGVVRVAQRVEQVLLVVLARTLPGGQAALEFGAEGRAVEALVQQPLVGELVDDAGVAHQVLHGPARRCPARAAGAGAPRGVRAAARDSSRVAAAARPSRRSAAPR